MAYVLCVGEHCGEITSNITYSHIRNTYHQHTETVSHKFSMHTAAPH